MTASTRRSYANSEQQYAEACTELADGVNSNFRLHGQPVPLVFRRGAGARLYDVDYRSYQQSSDSAQLRSFLHALQEHGVRPTSRGTWFLSTAHTNADVDPHPGR